MNKELIIPIGDYLLISVEENKQSDSPLILDNDTPDNRGIVKAVGDKVNTDEESTKINVNDKVIFSPGAGIKVTNSDESDVLMSVKNIIGIIKEGD